MPILFSYYSYKGSMIPLLKWKSNDLAIYSYSLFNLSGKNKSATMYVVHLPFKTHIHLLAITKRLDMEQFNVDTSNKLMERVSLEGDYGDYFDLYADSEMQMQARYVLDPKAMVFTIDFCKSHSWEIIDSEFYFLQESVTELENDHTTMFEDIPKFISEIKPAVTTLLTDEELRIRMPYGNAVKKPEKIHCPVCQTNLKDTSDQVYECPNGHGTLLHGSDIQKLRNKNLKLEFNDGFTSSTTNNTDRVITCPSCGSTMEKVAYSFSATIIDSCGNCQFRWLDAGELTDK